MAFQFTYLLFYLMLMILVINIEVEYGALLRDVTRSLKIILGGHGKSGNPASRIILCSCVHEISMHGGGQLPVPVEACPKVGLMLQANFQRAHYN